MKKIKCIKMKTKVFVPFKIYKLNFIFAMKLE